MEEFLKLYEGNIKTGELLGIVGEEMVLVSFLLNLDMYTVSIFAVEIPDEFENSDDLKDFNSVDNAHVVKLRTVSFGTLHDAEMFYLSLYNGVYINQVVEEYFEKKGQLLS